mmetsp:Transcript_17436/g.19584  ORF Transcript_17436/g.19584 Transcript_17436/m.19584 type:complete len:748 (+) Transcript_17436:40-2283(+)
MADNKQKSLDAKNHGNAAFKKKDWPTAIKSFSTAITLDPENHTFYGNRAAAYIKAKDFASAEADGEKCVALAPEWAKGYSRLAAALSCQKKFADAVKIYAKGLAVDPADRLLTQGLAKAQKNLAEAKEEKEEENEGVVVGIDLGTTFSCVAVWEGDGVTIIPNERGLNTTPSYVGFDPRGKRSTGQSAKSQAARYPTTTIYDVKRIIGQRFQDEGVEQDCRAFPFPVIQDPNSDKPMIEVDMGMHGKKYFAPEELSGMVLSHLKRVAENYLKKPVTQAVVTVPAYFNDAQRAATKAAGRIAGLDVLRIINEPTAAALSYGLDIKKNDGEKVNVLIFDLGGGTFDVSVLSIDSGVFEVQATGGDTRLGGEDFDNKLLEAMIKEAATQGISESFLDDPRAVKRLRVAVEKAKRQLSNSMECEISVEALVPKSKKGKAVDFNFQLSRDKFEKLNQALFLRCLETVKRVLKDAKLKKEAIDEIVLVGGSTRIPKLQAMLQEFFDGKALCKGLNPDEAVAYGAAVQGAILNGTRNSKTDNLVLMDVTPLSLGIETTGKVMSVIIPRNTPIPCTKTQCYTTEENFQTQVDIAVYEGERMKSDQNNLLGKFTISGIERAKRGEPKIDVTFSLDSNGMMDITAKDQKTGAEANIKIEGRSRSSEEDIERMIAEAAKFRKQDEERTARIEAKNEFEALIFEGMETVKDLDLVQQEVMESATSEAQAWLDDNGEVAKASAIKIERRKLERAMQKLRL